MSVELRSTRALAIARIRRLLKVNKSAALPVMAAPPTLSLSASQTITGTKTAWNDTKKHAYFGGVLTQQGANARGGIYSVTQNASTRAAGMGRVEFMTDAVAFEVQMLCSANYLRIWVDDEMVDAALYFVTNTGTMGYLKFDFAAVSATPTLRKISIEGAFIFGGVVAANIYTVAAPKYEDNLRMVVAGDSHTGGTGSTSALPVGSWAAYMANHLGIRDAWLSPIGGTGWNTMNGALYSLDQRFTADVVNPAPDIAVIAIGANDGPPTVTASLTPIVTARVAELRAAYPNALIIGISPWSPRGAVRTAYPAVRPAILAGYTADTSTLTGWIDTEASGDIWLTGTGRSSAPTLDGNCDWAVGPDGTHFLDAGHNFLGRRSANAILNFISGLA